MKIALGCDHRGVAAKTRISERLRAQSFEVIDLGTDSGEMVDYPDIAQTVGEAVSQHQADRGILFCGTGVGMSIAANKIPGIRAAAVADDLTAELSRRHNDSNVLCLSADLLGERLVDHIIDLWLSTEFEGGRHARRVKKIETIEMQFRNHPDRRKEDT